MEPPAFLAGDILAQPEQLAGPDILGRLEGESLFHSMFVMNLPAIFSKFLLIYRSDYSSHKAEILSRLSSELSAARAPT